MDLRDQRALWDLITHFSHSRAHVGLPGLLGAEHRPLGAEVGASSGATPSPHLCRGWQMADGSQDCQRRAFLCPRGFVPIKEQTTFSRKGFAFWENKAVLGLSDPEVAYRWQCPYLDVSFGVSWATFLSKASPESPARELLPCELRPSALALTSPRTQHCLSRVLLM